MSTNTEIMYRKAMVDDVNTLASLFDSYRVFYKQESDIAGANSFIKDRIKNRDSVIYMAFTPDGDAIGFTQLYPTFSSQSMQSMWILNDLFVDVSYRNSGVASGLINMASRHAKESSSKGLLLCTQSANNIAKNLYKKLGFVQLSDYQWYFLQAENT